MKHILLFLALAILAGGCRDASHSDAIPRRYAYPRIEALDTATVGARLGRFSMRINASADTAMPRSGWLDIVYPRYGVTAHLSANNFPDEASLRQAIDNRRERMQLNFGDLDAVASVYTNQAGIECMIAGSPDAGSAPVYFLAVPSDGRHAMLSGAVVFGGATKPVDSISPIYNAVFNDISNLLDSLE